MKLRGEIKATGNLALILCLLVILPQPAWGEEGQEKAFQMAQPGIGLQEVNSGAAEAKASPGEVRPPEKSSKGDAPVSKKANPVKHRCCR